MAIARTFSSAWSRHTWFGPSSFTAGREGEDILRSARSLRSRRERSTRRRRRRREGGELCCLLFCSGKESRRARREKRRRRFGPNEAGASVGVSSPRTLQGPSDGAVRSACTPRVHRQRRRRRREWTRSRGLDARVRPLEGHRRGGRRRRRTQHRGAARGRRDVAVERERGPRACGPGMEAKRVTHLVKTPWRRAGVSVARIPILASESRSHKCRHARS